ncbi:conserved hypothetical protein [Trichinella spiralis]|uniref:hypothetical protein n=1 Tax=Trichinella spiralis TaxID=6334 RepID=UPI0001EFBAE7|nr:conserved hypothetical protein [Trichinella spiralis]
MKLQKINWYAVEIRFEESCSFGDIFNVFQNDNKKGHTYLKIPHLQMRMRRRPCLTCACACRAALLLSSPPPSSTLSTFNCHVSRLVILYAHVQQLIRYKYICILML